MDKVTGKKSAKAAPANDQQMTSKLTAEESAVVGNADESSAETVAAPRVKEIVSMKNGTMKLRLEDGSEVDSGDASYSSNSEALVYETVAQMTNDVKVANVLVDSFHIQNKKSALDAKMYAAGIDEAFQYGKSNIPRAELASSEFASKLTAAQQEFVYRMGQRSAGKQVAKNKATVKKSAKDSKEKIAGKVHFDRKGRTFDKTREASLKTMEQLSAMLGTEFYVYESYVNEDGQRVYKDSDGNEASAPNGFYDPETGAIHIDLNAGAEGNGTMIFTVAHELTHFIKHWSDDKFKVLANFLVKQYGEKGVSVSELVQKQIDKAKRNGRSLTWDEAYEEMVADSMESMLTDGNVVQMMADLKQQDKTLWQKICDWFKDLANDLKELVEAYKGYKPDSPEGKMVADMQDTIVILESIYADALAEASENFQSAEKNTTEDGGVKMQIREIVGQSGRNYGIGVYLDSNALTNVPDNQREAVVRGEFKKFGGKTFVAYDDTGSPHEIMIASSKQRFKNSKGKSTPVNDHITSFLKHPIKREALILIDEVITASSFEGKEDAIHPHDWLDNNGKNQWDIWTVFLQEKNETVWEATLKVANSTNGEKVLYEMYPIKEVEAARKSGTSSTDLNVTQPDSAVKKKLSDRDSEGNQLSKKQQEYFKNSKVRDKSGNLLVMYHGTRNGGFTVFDRTKAGKKTGFAVYGKGNYFTALKNGASNYGNRVISAYLKIEKPIITSAKSGAFTADVAEALGIKVTEISSQTISERIKEAGYDGVVVYGIDENEGDIVICVTYNSEQIKEVSNQNPTSDLDIRHSDRDPAAGRVNEVLQKENAKLKEDVQYLKDLVKLQKTVTGGTKFTKTSVEAMAGNLMKANNARGNKAELAKLLNDLYEYIAKGEELSWDGVKEMAQPAVDWLRKNTVIKSELSQYAREILHDVRTSRISLDESQTAEAAYRYGCYNDYRKAMMGSVIPVLLVQMCICYRLHELSSKVLLQGIFLRCAHRMFHTSECLRWYDGTY